MKAVQVRIFGRVQGVGFRYGALKRAHSLGLSGWVRNEPDGSVSLLLIGEPEAVEQMLSWCREGPPMARVERIQTTPVSPIPHVVGFSIR
jgi:acylphosphatase|nr:MAG: acylphosphatase [Bacteroidota bacterium]